MTDDVLTAVAAAVDAASPGAPAVLAAMTVLKARHEHWYWVGVYRLEGDELVVGPYVGPVTDHVRIPVGRGVCGTAVAEGKNQRVDDVSTLGNYLACNLETKSELVVLVRDPLGGRILGQIDVDSTRRAGFGADDESLLESVGALLAPHFAHLDARA